MEEWTRNFRRDLERNAYPLPLFLAETHWRFLCIHPFDDGNGRTARLLANYALLRKNLLPIVIKSDDRDRYISALQNADVGRILPLTEFMLENASWSIDLGIRAAKGESIQDPDDTAKEMELFVRNIRGPEPNESDLEILDHVFLMHLRPTLDKLESALVHLQELFRRSFCISYIGQHQVIGGGQFVSTNWERTKQEHFVKRGFKLGDERQIELREEYKFDDYTGGGGSNFGLILSVGWKLGGEGFSFEVAIDGDPLTAPGGQIPFSKLDFGKAEVDQTVEGICQCLMNAIDSRSRLPTE